MVMFFLPFAFHLRFLSLILMRTDLVVETSTRWKYQIRPPEEIHSSNSHFFHFSSTLSSIEKFKFTKTKIVNAKLDSKLCYSTLYWHSSRDPTVPRNVLVGFTFVLYSSLYRHQADAGVSKVVVPCVPLFCVYTCHVGTPSSGALIQE